MELEDFLNKLGKNVARLRTDRSLSTNELALECEMEKATIVRIEQGKVNPTAKTLYRIAKVLKVSVRDLIPKDKIE